jgi:hypothetical protein
MDIATFTKVTRGQNENLADNFFVVVRTSACIKTMLHIIFTLFIVVFKIIGTCL